MREIEVGCRVPEDGSMKPFGHDEVNELIREGWRVVGLKGKGALMREAAPHEGKKMWSFVGFAVIVQLEEPK
jgi:hypothetical protein